MPGRVVLPETAKETPTSIRKVVKSKFVPPAPRNLAALFFPALVMGCRVLYDVFCVSLLFLFFDAAGV